MSIFCLFVGFSGERHKFYAPGRSRYKWYILPIEYYQGNPISTYCFQWTLCKIWRKGFVFSREAIETTKPWKSFCRRWTFFMALDPQKDAEMVLKWTSFWKITEAAKTTGEPVSQWKNGIFSESLWKTFPWLLPEILVNEGAPHCPQHSGAFKWLLTIDDCQLRVPRWSVNSQLWTGPWMAIFLNRGHGQSKGNLNPVSRRPLRKLSLELL